MGSVPCVEVNILGVGMAAAVVPGCTVDAGVGWVVVVVLQFVGSSGEVERLRGRITILRTAPFFACATADCPAVFVCGTSHVLVLTATATFFVDASSMYSCEARFRDRCCSTPWMRTGEGVPCALLSDMLPVDCGDECGEAVDCV